MRPRLEAQFPRAHGGACSPSPVVIVVLWCTLILMIECRQLSKRYGSVQAVSDVSLQIRPGVVTGLLGPNGAGKSSLMRMMTSYLLPSEGTVTVCGHDTVQAASESRALIGYLPESAPAYPEMRVRDFVDYRAGLYGLSGLARRQAVATAMDRCWLDGMTERRIATLSKGYRQRVGLAGAIVHSPRVLILDEPTTGLDPAQILELRSLIRRLAAGGDSGSGSASGSGPGSPAAPRTILLSSHILAEVQATCDDVIIMTSGRVRASGTPAELISAHGQTRIVIELIVTLGQMPDVLAGELVAALAEFGSIATSLPKPTTCRAELLLPRGLSDGDLARCELAVAATASQLARTHRMLIGQLARQQATLEDVFMTVVREAGESPKHAAQHSERAQASMPTGTSGAAA